MEWLSKAVDLLKAGGWQLLMIAAAAATFLLLDRQGVLPGVTDIWRLSAWALMLLTLFLALAPALGMIQKAGQEKLAVRRAKALKAKAVAAMQKRFTDYLPFLTEHERRILGYLLKRKQKHFTADADAGHGAGLMAMGFIVRIGVAGQAFDYDKIPMGVPDPVWAVMEGNADAFAYEPEIARGRGYEVEVEPWRVPWGT